MDYLWNILNKSIQQEYLNDIITTVVFFDLIEIFKLAKSDSAVQRTSRSRVVDPTVYNQHIYICLLRKRNSFFIKLKCLR